VNSIRQDEGSAVVNLRAENKALKKELADLQSQVANLVDVIEEQAAIVGAIASG